MRNTRCSTTPAWCVPSSPKSSTGCVRSRTAADQKRLDKTRFITADRSTVRLSSSFPDEAGRPGCRDGADAPPVEPEPLWRRVAAVLVGMETALDAGAGRVAGLGASSPALETVRRLSFPAAEKLHLHVSPVGVT